MYYAHFASKYMTYVCPIINIFSRPSVNSDSCYEFSKETHYVYEAPLCSVTASVDEATLSIDPVLIHGTIAYKEKQ
jgi:hypothetical protein